MKSIKIFVLLVGLMIIGNMSAYSAEQNFMGMCQVDKEPWKLAWVNDSKSGWQVSAWFEKTLVTWFFKDGPASDSDLGLKGNNIPYKVEFKDLASNKTFIIKEIAYEQWDDGAKCYAGKLEKKFSLNGMKYSSITVSLVNEVNGAKDYGNYSLWRDLK